MRKLTFRWAAAGGIAVVALLGVACGDGDDTRTVTATDFRFENLPESVEAGTTLTLENESTTELHEMSLTRLPDDEERPVEELLRLPEDQLNALFSGPPDLVVFDPPGDAEPIRALGDGRLAEPGRYLVMCSIPTGADPAAFLEASRTASGGPPQVAGGPPHFVHGMFGEITVE